MKNELIGVIEDKFGEIKNNINDTYKKVVLNMQDIGILKKKVNELSEFNSDYKKNFSSKKNNFLKKRESVNMIDVIKNKEDKNYLKKIITFLPK